MAKKIKIGDKVKFLNEVGGGIVKNFIDKDTIEVLSEDDFEIPILLSEVIKIEQENPIGGVKPKKDNQIEPEPETVAETVWDNIDEKPIAEKEGDTSNIYMALLPDNPQKPGSDKINLYLINDSNFFVLYHILESKKGLFESVDSNRLEPNTKIFVRSISPEALNDFGQMQVQAIFTRKGLQKIQPAVDQKIEVNPVKLFQPGTYKENDFFVENALILNVFEENKMYEAVEKLNPEQVQKILRQKESKSPAIPRSKQVKLREEELQERVIDLHIHEIIEQPENLEAAEILTIQMDRFHEALKQAVEDRIKRVVFIHGVGNGKLKYKVRNELDHRYKKYQYQDASFREYGYGATLIILHK